MANEDMLLKETGIIPVIKIENAEHAVPLAQALLRGGIKVAEVTFRTSAAAAAIERIATAFAGEMLVCAGTVLSIEQANLAVACGARAIISPGTNESVVSWCKQKRVPVYPGCATPTEIESALAMGLTTVKLFPAEVVGGVGMLKALYGPYAGIRFMPTGGVSPENAEEYLRQPNVLACGASWVVPDALLSKGDFASIEQNARLATSIVQKARGIHSI